LLAGLRFAEALRLDGTTRSSSRTEKPDDDESDGPSKLGSIRLSLRFAMCSCVAVPVPMAFRLHTRCGDLRAG